MGEEERFKMKRIDILLEINELIERYPGLALYNESQTGFFIRGDLHFNASFGKTALEEIYEIEIVVPPGYPENIPTVKELSDKVEIKTHIFSNGSLCLGSPLRIRKLFSKQKNLVGFVEYCILPFLYSDAYYQKFNEMPFGELDHDGKGLLQFYREYLKIDNDLIVLSFLKILAENGYKANKHCPCNSGKKAKNCHGSTIKAMRSLLGSKQYSIEYKLVGDELFSRGVKVPRSLVSKAALKKLEKLQVQ